MRSIHVLIMACATGFGTSLFAQKADSLGLPGDNFDLYAALDLFKRSENPEAFEKALNSGDTKLNNLDLDADGKVDYVKVVDKNEGDAHSLVLQVAVSKTETQDVAVIEIEKKDKDEAHLQIVGDEDLYGKNYIVEPKEQDATINDHKNADAARAAAADNNNDDVYANPGNTADSRPEVVVNVWAWPSVQYIYGPAYAGWVSPWYWGYYPGWWQPWPVIYWGYYHRHVYRYHYPYYRRAYFYRCGVAHNYYYGRRMASETVRYNNRSGIYQQRQAVYKNSTPRGQRYNAMPARSGAGREAERGTINRERGVRNNNLQRENNGAIKERSSPNNTPRITPGPSRHETQPRREVQPRQQQPAPVREQPRQKVQPRQAQPRMQTQPAPAERGGIAPRGGSAGGHRGGR